MTVSDSGFSVETVSHVSESATQSNKMGLVNKLNYHVSATDFGN